MFCQSLAQIYLLPAVVVVKKVITAESVLAQMNPRRLTVLSKLDQYSHAVQVEELRRNRLAHVITPINMYRHARFVVLQIYHQLRFLLI